MERRRESNHPNEVDDHNEEINAKEPEPFPSELLEQPASARLAYFEHVYILEHDRLLSMRNAVLRHICSPDDDPSYRRKAKMVLVIGPPRVGKTTLIGLVKEILQKRAEQRMSQDPGYVPFVSITLESKSRFDWKGYYRAILQALDDPFLQVRRTATERDLREAVEKALYHRGIEVVIVDEAQHLAKATRGSTQQDQLDQLKYFENKLGVCHVLVGTYEMRPFRRVNAQLACRSADVHFTRYDARDESDRALFQSAVWAFQRQLPMPEEPPLVQKHWQFLYARSLGCIGILKQHLNDALALAISEGTKTVTLDQLKRTALAKDKLDLELTAILQGETDFAKAEPPDADTALLISLGILAPPPPTKHQGGQSKESAEGKQNEPVHPRSNQKRLPGERKPGRDVIGLPDEEQTEPEGSGNEEKAAV